jgi:predicted nuclease of predicted toxin-antitoxin system
MLRLLIDRDLNRNILRELRRRIPNLDAVAVEDIGLDAARDPELLELAAAERRIIVTHDQRTMPGHVKDRVKAGNPVSGVVIIPQDLSIGIAIEWLETIVMCSDESDCENIYKRIPL